MRNIININCSNADCNGVTSAANGFNELILSIIPSPLQMTNYRLEITDHASIVYTAAVSNLNYMVIASSYWNGDGIMKVRLLSDEENSDYIIFNCKSFTSENEVFFKLIDGVYHLCICSETGEYELPIATATRLGGIKVGDNLFISTDGKLDAEANVDVEAISNLELENLLT